MRFLAVLELCKLGRGPPRPGPHLRRPAHHLAQRQRRRARPRTGGRLCRLTTCASRSRRWCSSRSSRSPPPSSPTCSTRTRRPSCVALGALRDELAAHAARLPAPRDRVGLAARHAPRRPRPRAALREPRRLAPALHRRARDPRDRRVPPARLARPDRRAARRQRRRRGPPLGAARLHRGEGARRGSRASPCCSARPSCSWTASGSARSTSCPPIAEFLDGLEEARALAGELAER